nr:phytanoyl-CoA dioxygenase family protein [Duganella lactea]
MRGLLPPAVCETARLAFLREVWPARRAYFKRHASGRYERNVYTEHGHMKYPIMNLQDIGGRRFRAFRQHALELLTHPHVRQLMQQLFGEPARLVHTMYFDGNQATWAHRDGDYLDASAAGQMIGVWIAAEDIHPDAGRFYLVPGSHRSPSAPSMIRNLTNAPTDRYIAVNNVPIVLHEDSHTLAGVLKATIKSDYPLVYSMLRALR